jgi:hypothetical protein
VKGAGVSVGGFSYRMSCLRNETGCGMRAAAAVLSGIRKRSKKGESGFNSLSKDKWKSNKLTAGYTVVNCPGAGSPENPCKGYCIH